MSYIKNPVQIAVRRIVSKDEKLKVDYPVALGLENTTVMEKINNNIKALVYRLIEQQGYYEQEDMTIDGWFEIKNNQRGILSLSIGNYAYPYHAAHGMTVIKSLTFDIETGKSYDLSELFKPDSNYVSVLSDIVAAQIKERDIGLLSEFKGISPNQDFYIADKSLVLYFQLYELAPYVYGLLHFPISGYNIQDIIKEDGPMGIMIIQ